MRPRSVSVHDRYTPELRDRIIAKLRESLGVVNGRTYRMLSPRALRRLAEFVSAEATVVSSNRHHAIAEVDSPEGEPGTIVQVLRPGYVYHERLLRPALVSVARAPSEAPQSE